MVKKEIISEVVFSVYRGLIRVTHLKEITASEVATFLRAMPGVVTVTAIDSSEETYVVVLRIKLLTTKKGQAAYEKLRSDAFRLIPNVKKVEISNKSIERVEL